MEELDYKKLAQEKKDAILNDLKELIDISKEDLIEDRYLKFRKMGNFYQSINK